MTTLQLPLPDHVHPFNNPSFPSSAEGNDDSGSASLEVCTTLSTSLMISRPKCRSTPLQDLATPLAQPIKNVELVLYHPLNPRRPAIFSRITGKIQQDPLTTSTKEDLNIDSQAVVRAEIHEAITSSIVRPRSMSVPTFTIKSKQFIVHKVSPTDSVHGVALRYGIEVERLRRINKLWPTDPIQIRENVYLPSHLCSISRKEIEMNGIQLLRGEEIEQQSCLKQKTIFFSPLASEVSTHTITQRPRLISSASTRTYNSATDYWLSTSVFSWSAITKAMGSVSDKLKRSKTWTGDKPRPGGSRRPSLPENFTRIDSEFRNAEANDESMDIPLGTLGKRFI